MTTPNASVIEHDVDAGLYDVSAAYAGAMFSPLAWGPTNQPPAGTNGTITATEDTAYVFSAAAFGFTDPDPGNALAAVRIDTLPTAGVLLLSGVAISAGAVIQAASLSSLTFVPAANAIGTGYASFTFSVSDGTVFDATPNTLTVNVTAVNDAPTIDMNKGVTKAVFTGPVPGGGGYSIAVLPNGDILAVGSALDYTWPEPYFGMARFDADGVPQGTANLLGATGAADFVGVTSDGKIVIAGNTLEGDFKILRFNANGAPDTSFGDEGVRTITSFHGSMALHSDGSIVVAGGIINDTFIDPILMRLNVDGSVDHAFGDNGAVETDFVGDLTLEADGQILVTGRFGDPATVKLARYNADGSLDAGFGSAGVVTTPVSSNSYLPTTVMVQADGKIIFAGSTGGDILVVRYHTDGSLDTSFGIGGTAVTDVQGGDDLTKCVVLQPDGKILVGGTAKTGSATDFAMLRYNSDGTLDSSFGGDGKITTPGFSDAHSIILQPDGKIVVAGVGGFLLARYNADGSPDLTFGEPKFVEGQGPVVLARFIEASDLELAATNYSGAAITLEREGGANSDDVFGIIRDFVPLVEGGVLALDELFGEDFVLGSVIQNSGGRLILSLNQYVTQSRLNDILQAITYANHAEDPSGSAVIRWTISDGNTGAQGTGGAGITTATTTVKLEPRNDWPSNLQLGNATVSEFAANGTVVGTLTSVDPDGPETHYVMTNDAGGRFAIGGVNRDQIVVKDGLLLDFEQAETHSVRVRVADNAGGWLFKTFTITLGNVSPEIVVGDARDNVFVGGNGGDTLDGRVGADTTRGGLGDDTYYVDNLGDQVIEVAGEGNDRVFARATYVLAASQSIELLATAQQAGTAAINLTGNEIGQRLNGNAGNNVLDGGGGGDQLYGFAGNDTFYVNHASDQVFEAAGQGDDRVFARVSYTLGAGQAIELLATSKQSATTAIDLTGNEIGQRLNGNAGINVLDGGGGGDQLYGFAGSDAYFVNHASDQVFEAAGEGTDTVYARVTYTLAAGQSIEVLAAAQAASVTALNLTGNELGQTLLGNAGNNVLDGSGGIDQHYGYGGNDTYYVDRAADGVFEAAGAGTDTVYARASYTLAAGQSIEVFATSKVAGTDAINLVGNEVGQTIRGNAGANTIYGLGGSDIIHGGLGNDTLVGGLGVDTFVFDTALNPATNVDTIGDFNVISDKIQLENAIFTALTATGPLATSAFHIGSAAADADDRIIYDSASGGLSYDADGTGAGSATHFATLSTGLALTAGHFLVV